MRCSVTIFIFLLSWKLISKIAKDGRLTDFGHGCWERASADTASRLEGGNTEAGIVGSNKEKTILGERSLLELRMFERSGMVLT
jgi:hypothetical protein